MELAKQEQKQDEDQWDTLKFDKTKEDCKGKSLLNWRIDTRATLAKVKTTLIDEIKAMVKIPDLMQNVIDAYLIVLGYRTSKARKQAMKDFKDRKLDLLKAAKIIKPSDLTFNDWNKIQTLLEWIEIEKVSKIKSVCKDLIKWTLSMVQLRIAESRFPDSMKENVSSITIEKKTPIKRSRTAKKMRIVAHVELNKEKKVKLYIPS